MSSKIPKVGDLFDPSYEGMEAREIKSLLGGVADVTAEDTYTRQLSNVELAEKRELYTDLSIDVAEIQQEIKDFADLRKVDIKSKSKEMAQAIGDIKTRTTTITGTVFDFAYQEEGLMVRYDENGICIDVRALKAKEKQRKLFSITDKSGTND